MLTVYLSNCRVHCVHLGALRALTIGILAACAAELLPAHPGPRREISGWWITNRSSDLLLFLSLGLWPDTRTTKEDSKTNLFAFLSVLLLSFFVLVYLPLLFFAFFLLIFRAHSLALPPLLFFIPLNPFVRLKYPPSVQFTSKHLTVSALPFVVYSFVYISLLCSFRPLYVGFKAYRP